MYQNICTKLMQLFQNQVLPPLDFAGCKSWLGMPEAKPCVKSIAHFLRCLNTGKKAKCEMLINNT